MDKVAEDDTYGVFRISGDHPSYCTQYQTCKVIEAPFAVGRSIGGGGWIFQKRSPFLPIFRYHYWKYKEAGLELRIWGKPEYSPHFLLPDQECETLDGHPVSIFKLPSVFVMLLCAACLSIIIFA